MTQIPLDTETYWLIAIISGFFLVLFLINLISFFDDFTQEFKHLNEEINRTYGVERRYWIRRKRKLLLSLIPFVKY